MAGGGGGEGEETNLELTPTWVVAVVCTVIVAISLALERILHYLGKVCVYVCHQQLNWKVYQFLYYCCLNCVSLSCDIGMLIQFLLKKKQKPLFEALQKIKEGL